MDQNTKVIPGSGRASKKKEDTVTINLTLSKTIYNAISKIKKKKGLPYEQDVMRIFIANGVAENGE